MSVARIKQQGFTLLEVLLAGFILFTVISSMMLVYRGALVTSGKAEESLVITAAVVPIRRIVSEDFRAAVAQGDESGGGNYGDLTYQWEAQLIYRGSPDDIVIEDRGEASGIHYFMWTIKLSVVNGNIVRHYQFSEITW